MKNYDWIVIGAGITGSALSYELTKQGFTVLLLEKDGRLNNATRYSYGGLAYWSGTTELTRILCQEGIEIHRQLSAELEADTEFREIDLVLTIDRQDDPPKVLETYSQFAIQPQLLSVEEACQLEPLLNPQAISGVLKLPHGHIHPWKTNQAYQQAFLRLGGEIKIERAVQLLPRRDRWEGVASDRQNYYADRTVVCAGGLSRALLQEAGIKVPLYFTHAQAILTPPVDVQLRTLVMPAIQRRFNLEATASQPQVEPLWDRPTQDLISKVLDVGAIQFRDGSLCLGQISAIFPHPHPLMDLADGEKQIRQGIASILPLLAEKSGSCHHCLIAFAKNAHPLVGEIENFTGVHLFSGFTSTLVIAPPLARHFARWLTGEEDKIMAQLSPNQEFS